MHLMTPVDATACAPSVCCSAAVLLVIMRPCCSNHAPTSFHRHSQQIHRHSQQMQSTELGPGGDHDHGASAHSTHMNTVHPSVGCGSTMLHHDRPPCGTCAGMADSAARTPQQTPPGTQHSSASRQQQHQAGRLQALFVWAGTRWWRCQHPCGSQQSRPAGIGARSHLQVGTQASSQAAGVMVREGGAGTPGEPQMRQGHNFA